MQIDATPEQFRKLLTLVFLGEWVVNGSLIDEDARKALENVADEIYSLAPQFQASDWVEFCNECQSYHGNEAMENELFPLVDQYDEETFWDVLSHHLAYRDIMVGSDEDKPLPASKEMQLWRRKEQYDEEFRKHGLGNVRLVLTGGKKAR